MRGLGQQPDRRQDATRDEPGEHRGEHEDADGRRGAVRLEVVDVLELGSRKDGHHEDAGALADADAARAEVRLSEARVEVAGRGLRVAGLAARSRLPVAELLERQPVERELRERGAVELAFDETDERLLLARDVAHEVDVEQLADVRERLSGVRVAADRGELVELAHLLLERLLHALLELAEEQLPDAEHRNERREREEHDVRGEDPRPHAADGAVPVLPLLIGRWSRCLLWRFGRRMRRRGGRHRRRGAGGRLSLYFGRVRVRGHDRLAPSASPDGNAVPAAKLRTSAACLATICLP